MKTSKLERLSHIAIIIIALSALVVSVLQTRIQHNHNKLSVKPYLHHSLIQNLDNDIIAVYIVNDGFGPAIIESITFTHNNITYHSLEDYLRASGEIKNRKGSYNYDKNSVFKSSDKNLIVELRGLEYRNVKVKITYKSIYEEQATFSFSF